MINRVFDKIFCINLQRRADRRQEAEHEFAKHNINVDFINAIDGKDLPEIMQPILSLDGTLITNSEIGCLRSHLQVANNAVEQNLKSYFVFEDDVQLRDGFSDYFDICIKQLPDDWSIVYLGGNNVGRISMVSNNIARTFGTYTTHAYGVKNTAYAEVIRVLSSNKEKADISLSLLQIKLNCYIVRPHLAWQRESFSDILEKYTDYKHLKK